MDYEKYLTEQQPLGTVVAKGVLRKAKKHIDGSLFFVENQLKLMKGGRAAKIHRDPEMDKAIQKLESWVRILKGIK